MVVYYRRQLCLSNPYSIPHSKWGNDRGFDKILNICMSNAPVWGLGFYVNPPTCPMLPPIVPGRGVVGHYIDRCILSVS